LFFLLILYILRYIFQPKSVHYKYRFQCPDSSDYDLAFYELQLDSLEQFPWNLVDNVVGNHGTGDHKLSDVCTEDKRKYKFLYKKKLCRAILVGLKYETR
jgi:hypothetical protein